MTRTRVPGLLLALLLGSSVALTACSSSTDDAAPADSGAPASSAPASTEPSASSEPTAETSQSSEPSDSSEDNGDKPSKADVVAGYSKVLKDQMPSFPDDAVKTAVTCIVDEIYDEASVKTLKALADGDATKVDPGDAKLFTDASTTCTEKIGKNG